MMKKMKKKTKKENIKQDQSLIPFQLNTIRADINNTKKDGLLMWLHKQQINIKCLYSSEHFNNSNYWRYAQYHKYFWNTNDENRFDGVLCD